MLLIAGRILNSGIAAVLPEMGLGLSFDKLE